VAELDLPRLKSSDGSFDYYRAWIAEEVARIDARLWLAGHSMGGALAISAAVAAPGEIDRLVFDIACRALDLEANQSKPSRFRQTARSRAIPLEAGSEEHK